MWTRSGQTICKQIRFMAVAKIGRSERKEKASKDAIELKSWQILEELYAPNVIPLEEINHEEYWSLTSS
jgi:hypothetical protein